jgi:hypothetical protein
LNTLCELPRMQTAEKIRKEKVKKGNKKKEEERKGC